MKAKSGQFLLIAVASAFWTQGALAQFGYPITAPQPLNTNASTDSGGDYEPAICTDNAGNWVVVWASQDSLGGTIGNDLDVLVARSSDSGATWTAPTALNSNAVSDSTNDGGPALATDGSGNWVAVWHTSGVQDIAVARSSNNGATWSAQAILNTNTAGGSGQDIYPEIATDGAGNWIAVWMSSDPTGGVGTDFDIWVARSTNNGASWTSSTALNTNATSDSGTDFNVSITTDRSGNWLVAWQSDDSLSGTIGTDNDILVSRSTNNGANWTATAALNTNAASDSGHDQAPVLATDRAGNWVAAWYSGDSLGGTIGTDQDVLVARSTNNGAIWTAPAALNANAASDAGSDTTPALATDAAGNWVAAWRSDENLGGTTGTDGDILAARTTNNGASWSSPTPLNINAGSDSGADSSAALAADASGNWVGTWVSNDTLASTIGSDEDILFAQFGPNILVDCNSNSISDATDISGGTSDDCNSNTLPDECEAGTWMGANGAYFSEVGNWDPAIVPNVEAVIENSTSVDNRCVVETGTGPALCGVTIRATGSGRQILQVQSGGLLTASSRITLELGGEVELQGGEIAGGVLLNLSNTVRGYGRISSDVANPGLIVGASGETLQLAGSDIDNDPTGVVRAPIASTVVVETASISQQGQLETHVNGSLVFEGPLTNSPGGLVTLFGGGIGATTLINDAGADVAGFGTLDCNVINNGDMVAIADMQIVGNLTNNGTIAIQSGILTVTGNLSGSGAIIGGFGGRSGDE